MRAGTIYKLMTCAEWEAAQEEGVYRGSAHDQRDGFIHFSTAEQLGETARKYFSGVPDLVLLAVDAEALKSPPSPQPSPQGEREHPRSQQRPFYQQARLGELAIEGGHIRKQIWLGEGQDEGVLLRFEPSRGGDLFPHLYAPLPISAVKSVTAVPLAADGTPIIPGDLAP